MKYSFKIIVSSFILLISISSVFAQRGGRWNADPKEAAERQTAQMTDSLALSEAQTAKVAEVNLKYAEKLSASRNEMRENPDADRSTMRTKMMVIMEERKTELQKYLTAEQFEKWTKIEAERAEKRREQRGDPKKGDRGKRDKKSSEEKS